MKERKTWIRVFLFLLVCVCVLAAPMESEAKKKKKKKVSVAKAKVTLSAKVYTYDKTFKTPAVKVKIGKKKLKKNRDYTVTYVRNRIAGKAKVVIRGKKKYKGKKIVTFKIKKGTRTIIPARTLYTAVEGDSAFFLSSKLSAGKGTIVYSCPTENVVKIGKKGKVRVKGKGTVKVTLSAKASACYKATKTTVTVTINKKPLRKVDSAESIKTFNYPVLTYDCTVKKLTDLPWAIESKYTIPGLAHTVETDVANGYIHCNNLCPQAICFAGDYLLNTAYCMDDIHGSCIYVYDRYSGAFLQTLVLEKKSHVGGIAFDGENIWICHADSFHIQRIPYDVLVKYVKKTKKYINYNPEELKLSDDGNGLHGVSKKPSAIAYNPKDGYLWVTPFQADESTVMVAYEYKDGKLQIVSREVWVDLSDAVVSGGAVSGDAVSGDAVSGSVVSGEAVSTGSICLLNEVVSGSAVSGGAVSGSAVSGGAVSGSVLVTVYAEREIPSRIQGLIFTPEGKVIFSRSYTRNTKKKKYTSELLVYDATWDDLLDYTWQLEMAVAMPPMAQEIDISEDKLYVLFESATMTYLEGTDKKGKSECPIDKIISVERFDK